MIKEYTCKHYYWDDNDNEYTLDATWIYERNYPTEPDNEILVELDVYSQDSNAPDIDHLLDKDGNIWRMIEKDGIDYATATERDYY